MNEETIRREASLALDDLELDSTVSNVTHSGKTWCVHFAGDYGQYCDTFQDQFDRDSSPRVVREKIKKHLLGQITQLRNQGRSKVSRRSFDQGEDERPNVTELFQEAVTQTARTIGEVIDKGFDVTRAVVNSTADISDTLSNKATETLLPTRTGRRPTLPEGHARTGVSQSEAGKAGRKPTKRADGQTKQGAGKKRAATSAKKASAKSGVKKRASGGVKKKKSGRKVSRKK